MYTGNGSVECIVTENGARLSYGNYHLFVGPTGVVVQGTNGSNCNLNVIGNISATGTITGSNI